MSIVSGDCWTHARNAPVVEGIEYFNYSNHDIIVTDRLGIEMEILKCTQRPEQLSDRGKVVVRVTRVVDPRRVNVTSTDALLECDRIYLQAFKERIDLLKTKVSSYESETNQIRMTVQIEMKFDFLSSQTVIKSNLLGISIRETGNIDERIHGNNPEGYINGQIVKELIEIDHEADEHQEKGIRTLFSARLIDNHNRLGALWTSGFGDISRVLPFKDEEQVEGLYLAGGLRLENKSFIPIDELLDPKKLVRYNLHKTEWEARKHNTGEYTASVTSENEKLKKERSDLRNENKKLVTKVDDLEVKIKVEKINRAQSDFKQVIAMEKLKEYGTDNILSSASRLITTVLANFKVVLSLLKLLKI